MGTGCWWLMFLYDFKQFDTVLGLAIIALAAQKPFFFALDSWLWFGQNYQNMVTLAG